MNVANLQRHLADLKTLLEESGVKGAVLTDLGAIVEALKPFQSHPLKDFADFLVRAEAFSRGEVPVTPPKGQRAVKPSTTKAKEAAPDVSSLTHEAKRLWDQAAEPSVTVEMIESLAGRLAKLSKPGLETVAGALELKLAKSASKPAILQAIKSRILDRKGSHQRAQLLDRPTTLSHTPAEMQVGGISEPTGR
jgi:hypothetical protein